ncbi:uncharacterized protein LOC134719629 isoform X2 [Mytilus trossulus]|uniref:uncharacterized protein LOC134719629 isoform X2 n=1 Tax=Mytilus trossulus TaxID=6551 RepID=UPI003007C0FF
MAAFVVIRICFLFMFMLGGVECGFDVRDCEKKYSIDFALEEYNCKFQGDGLYTYEGVKDNIIKIKFDRLTEKPFLFIDGDVCVVEILGGGISCPSVRCTSKETEIWINTLKCNSEESSTITTDKQPTISPTSSTSSVTATTLNIKRTSRPATLNVRKTTGGADMNMCPTTPPMESTTMEAESSSIGWVVGFVVSCIDWMHAIFVLIITGVRPSTDV